MSKNRAKCYYCKRERNIAYMDQALFMRRAGINNFVDVWACMSMESCRQSRKKKGGADVYSG